MKDLPQSFVNEELLQNEQASTANKETAIKAVTQTNTAVQKLLLPISWLIVGLPIAWDIFNALQKRIIIFH